MLTEFLGSAEVVSVALRALCVASTWGSPSPPVPAQPRDGDSAKMNGFPALPLGMERMEKTAPTETFGGTIYAVQDAKTEILAQSRTPKLGRFSRMNNHRILLKFILLPAVIFPIAARAQKPTVAELAKLTESDGLLGSSHLGVAVALDGDTAVVGDANAGASDIGAAYVYVKPASGWQNMTQTAKLTSSDGGELDEFGSSVAIRGDTIVVGAPWHLIL
jgi:FG-GAP repeat